MYLTVRAETIN